MPKSNFVKDKSLLRISEFDSIPRVPEKGGITRETPSKNTEYTQVACWHCGNTKFEVLYTDSYETSVRCLECGVYFVVHDG